MSKVKPFIKCPFQWRVDNKWICFIDLKECEKCYKEDK
jgi:hypothetical protein